MLARALPRILIGAAVATIIGCQSSAVEPVALDVQVSLDRTTVSRGDTVLATATAEGGVLLGITIDYGDGLIESYNTSGARTAKVTFKHVYTASGAFTVKVVATDGVAGEKSATTQLQVN